MFVPGGMYIFNAYKLWKITIKAEVSSNVCHQSFHLPVANSSAGTQRQARVWLVLRWHHRSLVGHAMPQHNQAKASRGS